MQTGARRRRHSWRRGRRRRRRGRGGAGGDRGTPDDVEEGEKLKKRADARGRARRAASSVRNTPGASVPARAATRGSDLLPGVVTRVTFLRSRSVHASVVGREPVVVGTRGRRRAPARSPGRAPGTGGTSSTRQARWRSGRVRAAAVRDARVEEDRRADGERETGRRPVERPPGRCAMRGRVGVAAAQNSVGPSVRLAGLVERRSTCRVGRALRRRSPSRSAAAESAHRVHRSRRTGRRAGASPPHNSSRARPTGEVATAAAALATASFLSDSAASCRCALGTAAASATASNVRSQRRGQDARRCVLRHRGEPCRESDA